MPAVGGGYYHELVEVTECLLAGRAESAVMPLADTIAVQDVMGEVARQLGMTPLEGPAELEEYERPGWCRPGRPWWWEGALQRVGCGPVHAAVEALAGLPAEYRRQQRAQHRDGGQEHAGGRDVSEAGGQRRQRDAAQHVVLRAHERGDDA